MSTTALSQEKIAEITEELREKFFLFDLDGNNVMNTNELGAVMRSFGVNLTEEEISNLMKELDSNGSEVLEFGEFLRLMENTDRIDMLIKRKLKEGQIEDIKQKFLEFDADNTGSIDLRELGNVIRSLGQNPTDRELKDLMDELDLDKTNVLEFPEFLELMQHNSKYISTMLQKR